MIYTIGLIFVIILIIISLDDLIWDIYYFHSRIIKKIEIPTIQESEIDNTIPKMLAIIVAAYNEEPVLKAVIENLIISNQYPRSMYHIFLGVYPNDEGTMNVAKELENKYENVHKIVHVIPGPSSKADNINNVIHNIISFEEEKHIRFNGIIIHDSEDLVHPYELLLENYLLQYHLAIQMPVFPLQQMPKLSNVFKNMVSGTYADEFAENHYNLLLARTSTGSFVPSAGTGFVLSRDLIDKFENYNVFPVGSLTEDYKLSLQLKQAGVSVHYALENVTRLKSNGENVKEFIATRSMFPSSYKAAVRQKTRWIYGITMQTFKLRNIIWDKKLDFISKYSVYKDWKAKFGNLVLGPGYMIFVYFILSLFFNLPTMYPKYTLSWYLMVFLSLVMIERQILRGIAVRKVYGKKSSFISVLFPPLMPFRMILGNVINFHSTVNAWRIHLFGNRKVKGKKKPAWSKTDHHFLEEEILIRFRRTLGDTLLRKELISSQDLKIALEYSTQNNLKLGDSLRNLELVSRDNVVKSLCELTQKTYIALTPQMICQHCVEKYGNDFLLKNQMIPLFGTKDKIVIVTSIDSDVDSLRNLLNKDIFFAYTSESRIIESLNSIECNGRNSSNTQILAEYVDMDLITIGQALIALRYTTNEESIKFTLLTMGLLADKKVQNIKKSIVEDFSVATKNSKSKSKFNKLKSRNIS